jgi:hypothetical protein
MFYVIATAQIAQTDQMIKIADIKSQNCFPIFIRSKNKVWDSQTSTF